MKFIFFFLILSSMLVSGGDFILHAVFDSANPGTTRLHNEFQIRLPSLMPNVYTVVRAYPSGRKSHLLKFSPFTPNGGFSFLPANAKDIHWLFEGYGTITVQPDTCCAFQIFVPDNCDGRFMFSSREISRKKFTIGLSPGKETWQTIRMQLCRNGVFQKGDSFTWISLNNTGGNRRHWKIDKFALWSGEAPVPACPQGGTVSASGEDNKISWNASPGDFPISHYRVHRGSVANFEIAESNLLGKSRECFFIDSQVMRRNDFYKIVAVNIAGKHSKPTQAIQFPDK